MLDRLFVRNEVLSRIAVALLVAALAVPAYGGAPYQRPAGIADNDEPLIVAGYRALFTCSGHFFAGRPLEDIKKVELVDVEGLGYPDPVIDLQRRLVSAADASGKIVRIAAFRDGMGCTLLPPHWDLKDVPRLPNVAYAPTPDVSSLPFPAGDLDTLPEGGLDTRFRALRPVIERAFDGSTYGNESGVVTTAVVIVKDGKLIASGEGILNIDDAASIPEWAYPGDPRQAITYKQLLWMSSGLFSGGSNTDAIYFGGQDVISAATTTPLEVEPGTRWKYANNDTLLLMRALRHRLGNDLDYLRFPYDKLLLPLGMYHTRMETDHLGNFIGSSQTYTTARDLTRFGILLANDGVWNGRALLPKGWIKFSSTPAPTRPPQSGQWGYGAQFWLLDQMPGVPKGTFTTAGNKGQYVTIVPGHDLVIVRTGVDPNGKRFTQHAFVADVVKAFGQ